MTGWFRIFAPPVARTSASALCLMMLFGSTAATAQPPAGESPAGTPQTPAAGPRTRVYLDCPGGFGGDACFSEYLRERITFVDFVRQPQDADLLIIASTQQTGGGGREVALRFVGQNRFVDHDHEFRAISQLNDTENTQREIVLRTVMIGLLDYVVEDGIPEGVNVSVATERATQPPAPVDDPWNLWVFSIRGGGSVDADARSRERQTNLFLNADRVTENWKISFGGRVSQNVETFDLDEDEPFEVTRRDRNFNGFLAKSLGPHWSVGVRGRVFSSTFNNTRLSYGASPAVEFSVFPYEQYATRQLRIQYNAGLEGRRYDEVTIFGKLEEDLWQQEFSSSLDQRQPWGSLRAGASFSQYLHDFSKYQLESNGQVNLRITRGLSLNLSGQASRIHDQLSLPLRNATEEEVLLRIRQLQSNYRYRFNFNITYSFGSIYNNVINPRFDN
jgi:hypothetical protein